MPSVKLNRNRIEENRIFQISLESRRPSHRTSGIFLFVCFLVFFFLFTGHEVIFVKGSSECKQ